ncbi:MAG TPA: hypothetical protein VGP47_11455 [Parachlamydiaceae bacterium]|nr:hypothetical protein [Parachlamydiaceae bacterium]
MFQLTADNTKLSDIKLQTPNEVAKSAFSDFINVAIPVLDSLRSYYWLTPCTQLDLYSCANYFVWGPNIYLMQLFPFNQQSSLNKIKLIVDLLFTDLCRVQVVNTIMQGINANRRHLIPNTLLSITLYTISQEVSELLDFAQLQPSNGTKTV